ncbi:MAG: oligoendopeptidase F, partial [Synergistaceae bacterium]|nr:oligoendopeptidase F [Synergistaceae bacterium]
MNGKAVFLHPEDAPAADSNALKLPERSEIEERYKWNLEDIYPSIEAWEEAFAALAPRIEALGARAGKLNGPDALLSYLREEEAVSKELGRLYVYANMKSHEDLRVTRHQELADKAENLSMRHAAATAFFRPELLALSDSLEKFTREREELRLYAFLFSELLREKEHVLPRSEEEILARTLEIGSVAQNAFTMLTDADIEFPTIQDEN